jgi:hypothetical protein
MVLEAARGTTLLYMMRGPEYQKDPQQLVDIILPAVVVVVTADKILGLTSMKPHIIMKKAAILEHIWKKECM